MHSPLRHSRSPRCGYAKHLGVEWKPNALRHSFISYLVTKSKNLPAVALEAGNSVAIIHRRYHERVTEAGGKKWFSVAPDACADMIRMKKGSA